MTPEELADRLLDVGARVVKMTRAFPKDDIGRHIALQVMRSATSAGANYEEARGGERRADFCHKTSLVLKEIIRETLYWLRLIKRADMVKEAKLMPLLQEVGELCAIMVATVKTAKVPFGKSTSSQNSNHQSLITNPDSEGA